MRKGGEDLSVRQRMEEHIQRMYASDWRSQTNHVRKNGDNPGHRYGSVQAIMHDVLEYHIVFAHWIPKQTVQMWFPGKKQIMVSEVMKKRLVDDTKI